MNARDGYLLPLVTYSAMLESPVELPKESTGCCPISCMMTETLFILRFLMMNSPPRISSSPSAKT